MALSDLALVTLIQAKNYLRVDAAGSLIIYAESVGEGDGNDTTFSLDNTPIDGSLRLYVNNILQVETDDYTISGADITFIAAPGSGLQITASYEYTAGSNTFEAYDDDELADMINAATKIAEDYSDRVFIQGAITEQHQGDGDKTLRLFKRPVVSITSVVQEVSQALTDGDGSTTAYTLALTPKSGSVKLYVDAVLKTITTDYTVSDNVITFLSAPADGAKITVTYTYAILTISGFEEQLSQGRIIRLDKWKKGFIYTVVYVAGEAAARADTQAAVPDAVAAVLLIIKDLYDHRGDTVDSESIAGLEEVSYKLPSRAERLLTRMKPLGGFV